MPVRTRFASNYRMISSVAANKSSLKSVVTMPLYPAELAKTMTKSALKEEGITADMIAKAERFAAVINDEEYWDGLAGIAKLWEPFAEVTPARLPPYGQLQPNVLCSTALHHV